MRQKIIRFKVTLNIEYGTKSTNSIKDNFLPSKCTHLASLIFFIVVTYSSLKLSDNFSSFFENLNVAFYFKFQHISKTM
jgi:hypothetical protein